MTEKIMRENLMTLAQTFADANGWAIQTVSKKIHGNSNFLDNFASGKASTTLRTYFAMVDYLRAEWPAKTPWPRMQDLPPLGRKSDLGKKSP